MPELFLIDAIGPFFKPLQRKRVNWSKIPFHALSTGPEGEEMWAAIGADLEEFARKVVAEGFNAVTLDDLAHLTDHEWYEEGLRERIGFFAERFQEFIAMLRGHGLQVFVTSDVLTLSPAMRERLGPSREVRTAFYLDLVRRFFRRFPEVEGLVLRIGESDGLDVRDELRSELHLRGAGEANAFLRELLPVAERAGRRIILRTWTVGAHQLGDLILQHGTLERLTRGIHSPNFVLSMKPGDSDFFRYLELNEGFRRFAGPKILELQARPEYEGAGELPTFLGYEYERYREALRDVPDLVGVSVWCQTGGWHRFRRYSFFGDGSPWAELNARMAVRLFRDGRGVDEFLATTYPGEGSELLGLVDRVVRELYYIAPYARQTLYFRRVRVPPLLHVYWDTVFVIAPVRKLMRLFVADRQGALKEGEEARALLPRMLELVGRTGFPREDVEFMVDTLEMVALARRYYFEADGDGLAEEIEEAKQAYKLKWPRDRRARFRIKTNFAPVRLRRRTLRVGSALLLRRRAGYRLLDYLFSLTLLSYAYRFFRRTRPKALPKFVRKSAMGVDSLFE